MRSLDGSIPSTGTKGYSNMATNVMEREPIFWSTTRQDSNLVDRTKVSEGPDGEVVVERIPQTGHVGDYETAQPMPVRRFVNMVRHDGHVGAVVLTNAAADPNVNGPFAQYQRNVAFAHGWYWMGACPVALIASGELRPESVVDKSIRAEKQPCERGTYDEAKPCKHALAERTARRDRNAKVEAERAAAFKDPTERQIDANAIEHAKDRAEMSKLIAALIAQNQALAASIAKGK